MTDHNYTNSVEQKNHTKLRFIIGIAFIISGILDILVSLNLIPYIDTRPNRIAIFNNPHTWQVFALGATLLFFGIANILPARMKTLGRINIFLLIISFIAVLVGIILEKIR